MQYTARYADKGKEKKEMYEDDLYDYEDEYYEEEEPLTETELQDWLRKMEYTVKRGDDGTPYMFLAILCGLDKVNATQMTQLGEYVFNENYPDDTFCMDMWIGGKVNWTMIYQQPFTHINGRETYFCHGVGRDNYSPDDWERDYKNLRETLGRNVTQKDFIEYLK